MAKQTRTKTAGRRSRAARPLSPESVVDRFARVARIGALFIEGEDVVDALTPESRTWTSPDDINFNGSVGAHLKKTLLRIERIDPDLLYYATLWRRRPDKPDRVEIVLGGGKTSGLDLGKGTCPEMFPALRTVFDRGRPASRVDRTPSLATSGGLSFGHVRLLRVESLRRAGGVLVSYFHPIRDSRENVVAALELCNVGSDS